MPSGSQWHVPSKTFHFTDFRFRDLPLFFFLKKKEIQRIELLESRCAFCVLLVRFIVPLESFSALQKSASGRPIQASSFLF